MSTEITEFKFILYMRSHNLGNIHRENVHIRVVERKKLISRKRKYIFTKKLHHNYKDILGYRM